LLDSLFQLNVHGTSVRTEVTAGLTTFLTMAYIIFVQPAILSGSMFDMDTGIDFGAITTATCLAAALATLIMGLHARYPIALAPGMGENLFFVLSALPVAAAAGFAEPWRVTLGAVFVAGLVFLLLSLTGVREKLLDAVSPSMKRGIAVGIGLFIAFIGLANAGVVVADPGAAVKLNPEFLSPDLLVFFIGLLVGAVLHARRVVGSIIWGIAAALVVSLVLRVAMPAMPAALSESSAVTGAMLFSHFSPAEGIFSLPPSLAPTFFQMDIVAALSVSMLPIILIFLFMDVFDTAGTLIAVGEQAELMEGDKLPRANRAMMADAIGTSAGACLGTSTVTSFIESAAGVEAGGRTGLTAVTVALLFLIALFFSPFVAMVGSYPPITAPALVLVGTMMMSNVRHIEWSDRSESIPAVLTMMGIPFLYSIGDGIALGLVMYPVVKSFSGRARDVRWTMWILALLLVAYFVFVRSRI
jgi:AGZA family xanthine/uracil permease-like MFS transporter